MIIHKENHEVMVTIDEAFKMMNKGKGLEEIIETVKR